MLNFRKIMLEIQFEFHSYIYFHPENTNGNCPDHEGTVRDE